MSDPEETKKKDAAADLSAMLGIGGLFDGVSNLITKFGELAEKGEALRNATHQSESPSGKKMTTSYGFNVKFGPGGDGVAEIKPMQKPGQTPRTQSALSPVAQVPRVREPHVELFDEGDHLLVIAEMPGVSSEDVHLSFIEKILHIHGTSKVAEFKKELDLPREFGPDQVAITANNGVIEIRLTKTFN
ncbi:MAG: Hsp20/alpha crystallin family protein [Planctomycetota bacterium]|nr:Hsp20/alpha crystallin family protein [Planctomycetota bacterium]